MEFAQAEHFRAEHGVFQRFQDAKIAEKPPDFELRNEFQFVRSSVTPNRVEKRLVKRNDPLEVFVDQFSFDGNLLECVEYPGNVDRLGTARRTRLTRNALPNGGGPGGLIDVAVLDQPDQRTGNHVHLIAHRTTGGAFSALVAIGDFRVGKFFNSGNLRRYFCVHKREKEGKEGKGQAFACILRGQLRF